MALVKGTNAYATVAEADTFFADRIDVAAWTAADATKKAQALVTAAAYLEEQHWIGSVNDLTQPLAFPRLAEYFDPRLGCITDTDPAVVPDRIIHANMELAYHLVKNANILDSDAYVRSVTVGAVVLDHVTQTPRIPNTVNRLIRPLLVNQGSNAWWRAN